MLKLAAAAAFTAKVPLVALLKPAALAVNCLLPLLSISRLVNEAVPLLPAVPISMDVVPCSGPVPLVKATVRGRLEGKAELELLPNASTLLTTGWISKAPPAVALLGCVAKARALAVAGLTAIEVEVVLTRLVPVKSRVMVLATL